MTALPGLSSTITGPYKGTWNGLDVGHTESGFRMFHSNSAREITSDMFGDGTILDKIYTGTSVTISMTLIHWNAQAIEPMMWWMGNDTAGFQWGRVWNVGQLHFAQAKPFILTSCFAPNPANTSNPLADPVTIVFPRTLMRPNEQVETLFSGTQPRFLNITLDVFPIDPEGFSTGNPFFATKPSDCSGFLYFDATRNPIP